MKIAKKFVYPTVIKGWQNSKYTLQILTSLGYISNLQFKLLKWVVGNAGSSSYLKIEKKNHIITHLTKTEIGIHIFKMCIPFKKLLVY